MYLRALLRRMLSLRHRLSTTNVLGNSSYDIEAEWYVACILRSTLRQLAEHVSGQVAGEAGCAVGARVAPEMDKKRVPVVGLKIGRSVDEALF